MGFDRIEEILYKAHVEGKEFSEALYRIAKTLPTKKYRELADRYERAYAILKEKNDKEKKND